MMRFAADLGEVVKLGQNIVGAAVQSDANLAHAIDVVAPKILEEQIANVPIRTGLLRDSLRIVRDKPTEARIGAFRDASKGKTGDAGWRAHFIENGTAHSAPRPFIRPAGDKYAAEFARTILKAPVLKP